MPRMFDLESSVNEPEMQVVDLRDDGEFMTRENRARGLATEVSGIQRLANIFAQRPKKILCGN
jgi:hypothetical protein